MINLNLLTQEKKSQIIRERQFARSQSVILSFVGLFALFAGLLITTKLLLTSHLENLREQTRAEESSREAESKAPVTKTIHELNATLQSAATVQVQYSNWVEFLVAFSKTVPPNIRVNLLDIRKLTGDVQIKGYAVRREDLVTFKQHLEESGLFLTIVSPISNLIQKDRIDFQFDATISSLEAQAAETGSKSESSDDEPT